MPVATAAQLTDAYRTAQAQEATQATAQTLLAFRLLLDPRALDRTFPVYAGVVARVLGQSRSRLATIARAFYVAHRIASGVVGAAPEIADVGALPAAQVTTSLLVTGPVEIRRLLGEGFTLPRAVAAAERKTSGAAYRHAADGGRQTIVASALADPVALGWARVTDGDPCYFCAMLASRDVYYKSEQSGLQKRDGEAYHDHCGCCVEAVYTRGAPLPGRGEEFAELWRESTKGKGGKRAINAFRRALEGRPPA